MSEINSLADLHKLVINLNRKATDPNEKIAGLHIGEVSGSLPTTLVTSTIKAINQGELGYTSSLGLLALRQMISQDLNHRKCVEVTPDQILITNGSKQGLFYAINLLVKPGDEVILHRPYWNNYQYLVEKQGGILKTTRLENNGNLNLSELTGLINEKTKMIILCSPHNPTGSIPDEENLRSLAQLVKGTNIKILVDEIYEKLDYTGKHKSMASFPGLQNHVVTVGGFSKSHQMTGFRIGYLFGPNTLINEAAKLQANICTCACSLSQYVALEAIQNPVMVDNLVKELRPRLDNLKETFKNYPIWEPRGAFYLFIDITQKITPGKTDRDVCQDLLKRGVAIAPGSLFHLENHIRISYACQEEIFKKSLPILDNYFNTD